MAESALGVATLDHPASPAWDGPLAGALRGEGVRAVYQPIIDLGRFTVVGYEALSRFDGVVGIGPDRWFEAAAHRGLVTELELVTLRTALAGRADLPRDCFLSVNVEPESLADDRVMAELLGDGCLTGLVIEVTEHRQMGTSDVVTRSLDELRGAGARLAVDDAGSGWSGLRQILDLRPSIVKLDRALVEGVDRDESKTALVEMLGHFANRLDAWLLAEGVETEGEARRLIELGVPLAQGYLFARPGPRWVGLDAEVCGKLRQERAATTSGSPLRSLVETGAWVREDEAHLDVGRLVGPDRGHVVVLDDDDRPVGLVTEASAASGTIVRPLRVNLSSKPSEVAHRLSTRRPVDTASPVVVTDNRGRYVGTIPVTRLLAHLASSG